MKKYNFFFKKMAKTRNAWDTATVDKLYNIYKKINERASRRHSLNFGAGTPSPPPILSLEPQLNRETGTLQQRDIKVPMLVDYNHNGQVLPFMVIKKYMWPQDPLIPDHKKTMNVELIPWFRHTPVLKNIPWLQLSNPRYLLY